MKLSESGFDVFAYFRSVLFQNGGVMHFIKVIIPLRHVNRNGVANPNKKAAPEGTATLNQCYAC